MTDANSAPISSEIEQTRKNDRVDTPQQYGNWRDYAFSEAPERDADR